MRGKILAFAMFMMLNLTAFLHAELINQAVVNVYCNPENDTEVDTQVIYGSVVEVLETKNEWSKIKTTDGVKGWVHSLQLIWNPSYANSPNLRPVKSLFAHIYRVTDTTPYPPLQTLTYGTKIKLENVVDSGERWVAVELISGEKAWIQRGDIDFSPHFKTLDEVLEFSRKFIGLPYTWGGATSYGFDCSGFIQMLFREMGFLIPRNSRDQAACDLFSQVEREALQPGDLIFFGQSRINHVGMYLGNDNFIHSGITERPMVMISSLSNEKYHYKTARRINPLNIDSYQLHTLQNYPLESSVGLFEERI